jgi:hypothetical protein
MNGIDMMAVGTTDLEYKKGDLGEKSRARPKERD